MKVAHLLVFGRVQGVGYRKFAKKEANKRGLVGWVRNLPEGTVEAEVAGDESAIEVFLQECYRGPFLSQVKTIDIDWSEKDFPFTEFVVRHDVE